MTTNAQERFVRRLEEHKKIIYKVATAYCGSADERADLEQEIVVQLWRSFERYDDSYRFSTWMYRCRLLRPSVSAVSVSLGLARARIDSPAEESESFAPSDE